MKKVAVIVEENVEQTDGKEALCEQAASIVCIDGYSLPESYFYGEYHVFREQLGDHNRKTICRRIVNIVKKCASAELLCL